MADFDAFGDTPASDPAADFLASQQQKLAGIMDDDLGFGGASSTPNQQALFGDDQPANADGDFFSGDNAGGGFGMDANRSASPSEGSKRDMYSAIRSEMAEPEKIRLWREGQRERIAKKDSEEETRRKEMQTVAKRELDDWYKHYADQMTKTRAANRDTEKMLVAERDEALPTGTGTAVWDRVCRLCEFNPKNSKCQKDVSRYRSLLLQLKQTPPIRT